MTCFISSIICQNYWQKHYNNIHLQIAELMLSAWDWQIACFYFSNYSINARKHRLNEVTYVISERFCAKRILIFLKSNFKADANIYYETLNDLWLTGKIHSSGCEWGWFFFFLFPFSFHRAVTRTQYIYMPQNTHNFNKCRGNTDREERNALQMISTCLFG